MLSKRLQHARLGWHPLELAASNTKNSRVETDQIHKESRDGRPPGIRRPLAVPAVLCCAIAAAAAAAAASPLASRLNFLNFLKMLFFLPTTQATDILHPNGPRFAPRAASQRTTGRRCSKPRFFQARHDHDHDHLPPQTPQPTKLENYTGPPDCNTRLQFATHLSCQRMLLIITLFPAGRCNTGLPLTLPLHCPSRASTNQRVALAFLDVPSQSRHLPEGRQSSACRVMPWTSQG
jgi:hypothetical protein